MATIKRGNSLLPLFFIDKSFFIGIFIVYLYKITKMKNKLPFVVEYTKEMSDKFNRELKESGECSVQNPDFYGKWNMVEFGTPEYDDAFSMTRVK